MIKTNEYISRYDLYRDVYWAEAYSDSFAALDVLYKIQNFPAADVAPVRYARWIKRGGYCDVVLDCSACGNGILHGYTVFQPDGTLYTDKSGSPPWCPNCGAKMDVETP